MCEKDIKYGTTQYCPKCKMKNPFGLKLPEECTHCNGTGWVTFTNKPVESDGANRCTSKDFAKTTKSQVQKCARGVRRPAAHFNVR